MATIRRFRSSPRGKTVTGRVWVYVRDDRPFGGKDPPAALFYASRDRTREHPERHLASYAGILQADAFDGYNRLYLPDRKPGPIVEALCWSHARRKFFELADIAANARRGKTATPISPIAFEAVRRIDALFDVEREINGLSAAGRLAVRRERGTPLVAALEAWMRAERAKLFRLPRDNQNEENPATIGMRTPMGADRREGEARPSGAPPSAARFSKARWRPGTACANCCFVSIRGGIDGLPGVHITDRQMRLYMRSRKRLSVEAAAAKADFHRERLSDRSRSAPAVSQDGAEAAAGSARALLGRRGRADPQGRARRPGDRSARGVAPAPSQPQSQHPPHAGATHPGLAGAPRARAGRDLPPDT